MILGLVRPRKWPNYTVVGLGLGYVWERLQESVYPSTA